MPDIYIPHATASGQPSPDKQALASVKIAIDPITRIEGHLRVEVQVENGQVDAWSSTPMFRGIELILKDRDPRDAWIFAQRICGVCTTVNALASVRAIEHALGVTIPDNARILRNLIEGAQYLHDHCMHFYHLHGPDWVDIVSALAADPAATSELQKSLSPWPNNSPEHFAAVQTKLQRFVDSGQLGLFANAYWGHSAYKLPPEGNLLVMAHYLEALDWQRDFIRMHAILGGKNPHPQTYLVGGMAVPVDPNSSAAINYDTIATLRELANSGLDFVTQVYVPDMEYIASFYTDWAVLGAGPGNFLSYGDFPTSAGGQWLPSGIILNKDLSRVIAVDQQKINEDVTRAWYVDGSPLHPSQGVTNPQYTGPQPPYEFLNTDSKYSWGKAPRYDKKVMEVGPLARMLVAYAAGHERVRELIDSTLKKLGLEQSALFSALGRVLTRALETQAVAEQLPAWVDALQANMEAGNLAIFNGAKWHPDTWPSKAQGYGMTEAPRGALGHWVHISSGKIANYQIVIPSTWNGSPRDASGQRGAWEEALVGAPVVDPERPVEILRIVHSYDPCMACAVHVVDSRGGSVTEISLG